MRSDRLEVSPAFMARNFYGLPRNHEQITLVKDAWSVPQELPFHHDTLVPLRAGGTVSWR